jgi:prepilin-type processing-associated H-X9-DG protein
VTIAIIAILASLLLPALSSGQRKAREVQCLNNSRRLGLDFQLINGEDFRLFKIEDMAGWGVGKEWLCPSASKRNEEGEFLGAGWVELGRVDRMWSFPNSRPSKIANETGFMRGSYGFNKWIGDGARGGSPVCKPALLLLYSESSSLRSEQEIEQPSRCPLFFDCVSFGAFPQADDTASLEPVLGKRSRAGLNLVALPRHGLNRRINKWDTTRRLPGKVSVSFFDGHAEQVQVEMLWFLSWHKYYRAVSRPGLKMKE